VADGGSWRDVCRLAPDRPDEENLDTFAADAAAAIADAGWLPAPMLHDLWLAMQPRSRWRTPRFEGGYERPGASYEGWLRSWMQIRHGRVASGRGDRSALFHHAVRGTGALARSWGLDVDRGAVESPSEYLRLAEFEYRDVIERREPWFSATRAAYSGWPTAGCSLDEWPAVLEEARRLPFDSLECVLADRVALDRIRRLCRSGRAIPPVVPPVARVRGWDASKLVRAEQGPFHERSQGRLPDNVGQLAPLEMQYLRAVPRYFLYRLAENELARNYGRVDVPDRRDPIVGLDIEVRETAAWNRACERAPHGLVTTVREMVAALLVEFRRIALGMRWTLQPRLAWHAPGRADAWRDHITWGESALGRDEKPARVAEELARAFPVLSLPAHHLGPGRELHDRDVDLDVRVVLASPGQASIARTSTADGAAWITPISDGAVAWGEGTPSGAISIGASRRGDCRTAAQSVALILMNGRRDDQLSGLDLEFE